MSPEPILPKGATPAKVRQVEAREWWLWASAITITLMLTLGIASFLLPLLHAPAQRIYSLPLSIAVPGLIAMVLLFDLYTIYQQAQIHRVRRQLAERDELFRLISENAADMIAVVDTDGNRLYNSPAYFKVLGYSPEELQSTSALEQIHPDDRPKVARAAEEALRSGIGSSLEYRMRHRDGGWRILESTASVISNLRGEPDKLVIVNRDITARKRAEEKLAHHAAHDSLTSLPNRALLLDRAQHAFSHAQRHPDYQFAILLIDIDDFKKFNDTFGPAAGDQVLVEAARRFSAALQFHDVASVTPAKGKRDHTLARLSADEFSVLLDDVKDPSEAIQLANRVQEALAAPFSFNNGHEVFASASIGIALSNTPHNAAEDLIRDANIAMYRAKSLGKARFEVFDSNMHARAVDRLKLETELRRGLERCEFVNYYQPIVALPSGRIIGFETLARWQHPHDGLILPDNFIEVANDTGLISPINRWLLRKACEQAWSWTLRYPGDPPLIITANVTARQFADPNLAKDVALILRETRLSPQCLQIEITETIAMSDAERATRVLAELKDLGVGLCIDDFGTGYSSLSRLQRFPVDKLKIDRSFIMKLHRDPDCQEIVRVIISLGKHFGMKVVAEGTETPEQVKYLTDLGCDFAQGYFFSKPVDEKGTERLLMADANRQQREARQAAATPR